MRKALLVGINKYPSAPLRGCVNDVLLLYKILTEQYSFKAKNVNVLTDEEATKVNILAGLKKLVTGTNPGDVVFFHYSGHGCLSGDTKLQLLNGTEVSLKELHDNHKNEEVWVYSSTEDGNIVPAKAHSPRITKLSKTVTLYLDNGEKIICTPDHKFRLLDGSWVCAKDLTTNMSLMPLYKTISSNENGDRLDGYEKCYIPKYDNFIYTHALVAYRLGMVNKLFYRGIIIHHKDFCKLNNDPDNLEPMNKSDHAKIHSCSPERREMSRKMLTEYNKKVWPEKMKNDRLLNKRFGKKSSELRKQEWKTDEYRTKVIEGVKKSFKDIDKIKDKRIQALHENRYKSHTKEAMAKKKCSCKKTRKNNETILKNYIYNLIERNNIDLNNHLVELINNIKFNSVGNHKRHHLTNGMPNNTCIFCVLDDNGIEYSPVNHKITHIDYSDIEIPVYDITVEGTNNFALSCGVFAHNSQVVVDDWTNTDEADGRDEILCPVDLDWNDPIRDHHLGAILKSVPAGVKVVVVLDCCHSGTGLRNSPVLVKPMTENDWVNRFLPPPPSNILSNPKIKIGDSLDFLLPKENDNVQTQKRGFMVDTTAQGDAILVSGCEDGQTSADAWIGGRYQGALTFLLAQTLMENNFVISYEKLIQVLNKKMDNQRFTQNPQLEAKKEYFGLNFLYRK